METHFESNPLIDRLPKHLKQFIKPQVYEDYTPINQAVWRYVMRKNVDYLSKVAHNSYLEGLQKTGLEIDNIPNMYGMTHSFIVKISFDKESFNIYPGMYSKISIDVK